MALHYDDPILKEKPTTNKPQVPNSEGIVDIKGRMKAGTFHWGPKGWCRWGWFEDVVLNTFFGFVGEGKGFQTQIRSYSKENGKAVPNPCRFDSEFLYTIDKRVILPGRFFPIPPDDYLREKAKVGEATIAEYRKLKGFQGMIDDTEKGFGNYMFQANPLKEEGIIRNFVFSADFLIKHFGTGISNLESGLNSFWRSVSSIYGGFWDFEIVQSEDNAGRIQVIDKNATKIDIDAATPFPNVERKTKSKDVEQVGTDKDKKDPQKTFEFSVYSKDSIMTEFSVDVSLDSKMITQAMYHTNKDISTVGHSGMNSPEAMGIKALSTLNNVSKTQTEIDKDKEGQEKQANTVYNISTPYLRGEMAYPDGLDEGEEYKNIGGPLKLQDIKTLDLVTKQIQNARDNANRLIKQKKWKEGMSWPDSIETQKYLVYDIHGRMYQTVVRGMLFHLNKSIHSFRTVDPIVPFSVSFSLQGIAGITIGDLFALDYLPDVYREFALFQVSSVGHEIGTEGWKTSVAAIMRINMKGLQEDPRFSQDPEDVEDKVVQDFNEENQAFHVDAVDSEQSITAEEKVHTEKNVVQKVISHIFGKNINRDKILAVESNEVAGEKLVELRIIEDEMVRMHRRFGAKTYKQITEVLKLLGDTLINDITDTGVYAVKPPLKPKQARASDLLKYLNKLRGDSISIRAQLFTDIDKHGYFYKYPQMVGSPSLAVTQAGSWTKDRANIHRQFFTKLMETEKGLEGFLASGGGESGSLGDADNKGKAPGGFHLQALYRDLKFVWMGGFLNMSQNPERMVMLNWKER